MSVQGPPSGFWDSIGSLLDSFISKADELLEAYPEVTVTSWWRSVEHNREVGGLPTSQHLRGTAFDVVVPWDLRPSFVYDTRQVGLQPIVESDHVHVQWPRA